MILRLWRGWALPQHADSYDHLLDEEVAPSILARDLDGLHSFQVWRRPPEEQEGPHEFLTAMTFEDMGAEVRVRFVVNAGPF